MEPEVARQRPQHRRNASSKSNILKSLVSPRAGRAEQDDNVTSPWTSNQRTQTVPLLPPDHPHAATKCKPLGERQGNVQSPPSSPSKSRGRVMTSSKTSHDLRQSPRKSTQEDKSASPKKSRSSTNLSNMFAKMNRSSKDVSQLQAPKDKENTTPPSSSSGPPVETPIWAQYSSTAKQRDSRPSTRDSHKSTSELKDKIVKCTPEIYSPSKQRNFEHPQLRPTLAKAGRPQSAFFTADIVSAIGRRVSGDKSNMPGRKSEDLGERRKSIQVDAGRTKTTERKTSGSSAEHAPVTEKLNIAKRGSRVMAAVAAFNGKAKDGQAVKEKEEAPLDPKAVDQAFETVLDSRNVPEPMRQKMRSLTLRVKADFIKQNQESSLKTPMGSSPPGTATTDFAIPNAPTSSPTEAEQKAEEDKDSKSTKRSRARSRTFTFSKTDKRAGESASPSKKQRARSKSRIPDDAPTAPATPRSSMDKNRSSTAVPADFITYLRSNTDPVKMEVGRIHKLRILLRNETVAWVDSFLSLGGMTEITALLHRILAIEWREEHEDQLLHEALLCLKGLCTTERAMIELEKIANSILPEVIGMVLNGEREEKKGPAEYSTRGIVFSVLFNYLSAASPESLEQRARKILTYLGEPSKPEDARPVDFVLDMRISRPYKQWSREVSNVTKEVFWIFLHHLNVVPLPKPGSSGSGSTISSSSDPGDRADVLEQTYTTRHFPAPRPPVPAAPYIGGVEWDATTYLTTHLDLVNGLIASLPTASARNAVRSELKESGFEKVLGGTLRTCKEKFYGGVHDGLRSWVAAAAEDGWSVRFVREGPTREEEGELAMKRSPKKSPVKKEKAPVLEAPKLELKVGHGNDDDDGWLG